METLEEEPSEDEDEPGNLIDEEVDELGSDYEVEDQGEGSSGMAGTSGGGGNEAEAQGGEGGKMDVNSQSQKSTVDDDEEEELLNNEEDLANMDFSNVNLP
ncbi:hypothetical protein C0995_009186 [Termitomyces sp. Mi166|nr:hypothetical protein C0995_009186 [Termitomyces sp. Mi166\